MTDIPHFDYPFRFNSNYHAVVVEQDSIEDVESCLATALLTEVGDRIELPEFGINSPLFGLQPLDLNRLYTSLVDQEPRALMALAQHPDPLDYLTALVEIDLQTSNPTIGES